MLCGCWCELCISWVYARVGSQPQARILDASLAGAGIGTIAPAGVVVYIPYGVVTRLPLVQSSQEIGFSAVLNDGVAQRVVIIGLTVVVVAEIATIGDVGQRAVHDADVTLLTIGQILRASAMSDEVIRDVHWRIDGRVLDGEIGNVASLEVNEVARIAACTFLVELFSVVNFSQL